MAATLRVVNKKRQSLTALPLYHYGHLYKKGSKEKDFKKFYAELRGTTLFLYTDDSQDTYIEKLELELLKTMKLQSPYNSKMPTVFDLKLHKDTVQLKLDNADTGELWRGYILTVTKKEIPRELQLLPGQRVQLQEALDLEKARNPQLSRPPLPPRPGFLQTSMSTDESDYPECYFNVTREKAKEMLNSKPEHGNVILRPATVANNYALTFRQMTPSGPTFKNFRVSSTSSGYVIELDKPVTVSNLKEVLQYFIEKTEHRLLPYTERQPYDTTIGTLPRAPKFTSAASSAPSKQVPKAQVNPMPRPKAEVPPPEDNSDSGEYENPDELKLDMGKEDENKTSWLHETRGTASFEGELRKALKQRREVLRTDSEYAEGNRYVKTPVRKSNPKTVQWDD
ncbi:unnamed protein product [Ophioblennius macclurei]